VFKKVFLNLLATLLIVQVSACVTNKSLYPAVDVEMKLEKVSDHVYYARGMTGTATENQGFISNAAVIILDEGIILFDALGSPSLAEKILAEIRKISDKPIKKVFISHYHADHFYGVQFFKDMGAEIYAPKGAITYLNSEGATNRLNARRENLSPWINKQTRLVNPDHLIDQDSVIQFSGMDINILHFGAAHSHGDLSLYLPSEKVLLSGDLIFTGRIPFVGGDDINNWISKIETLAAMDANVIVPGHGAAFEDKQAGVKLTHEYLLFLRDQMAEAIDQMIPFDEVYAKINWEKFENLPAFKRANRINAYRVYLALEAQSF